MRQRDSTKDMRPARQRASFWVQAGALARKQACFQKRRWLSNGVLLAAPFLICMLLWVLQDVINQQLDSRAFRCGCKCLSCCDWVAAPASGGGGGGGAPTNATFLCYQATDERPCSPYAKCQSFNDSECGFLYSTAEQVAYCPVAEPPLWPALLEVPPEEVRGPKAPGVLPEALPPPVTQPPSAAPMLYTGESPEAAAQLMAAMWSRSASVTDAVLAAYAAAQAGGQDPPTSTEGRSIASEAEFVEAAAGLARGLYDFGLVMGTSAGTSFSLLMEPGFVSQEAGGGGDGQHRGRPPLYFALPNCTALSDSDSDTLRQIGQAITNMTGFPVECASLPPTWQAGAGWLNDQVYCGWRGSEYVLRQPGQRVYLPPAAAAAAGYGEGANGSTQSFVSALYDWHDTAADGLRVTVWVNNSDVGGGEAVGAHPPSVQRWAQPVNLAANAFIKRQLGPGATARLVGVKDMPRGASRLSLDFSSLLGPLFSMWLLQLMLPVGVHTLVAEKEQHLRVMMRMQGLRDSPFYLVLWAWHLLLYLAFVAVFCAFGGLIGLRTFTANSYSLQAAFYSLWGLSLTSWTFYFSAMWSEARPAVLLAVIWVIISGFMANLVMVQYIEQGPRWLAEALQLVPSFNLYRGLYELSQYAFLADRTGGAGLTWAKLGEPGCGMASVLVMCGIQGLALMWGAYYVEQVHGAGTGIRRHRLFYLGLKLTDAEAEGGSGRRWSLAAWLRSRRAARAAATAAASRQKGQGKGAVELAAAPASGASLAVQLEAAAEDDDWVAGYYGSRGLDEATEQLRSPQLPPRPPGAAAPPPPPLLRKPTSVRLAVPAEPAADGGTAGSTHGAACGGEEAEGADVAGERARVEALWGEWQRDPSGPPPAAVMLRSLRKVFGARDGNAEKVAVADLSLAIPRCECFGLLGPNGAGKTTTICMLEGFMAPSGGQALVEGLDIGRDMDAVHAVMGACPQHDLLWDGLTGREHLLFYARIKALSGKRLRRAVDDALRSVNLLGVGEELVGGYSGGMKRRLSVAIALVGDPSVVYLDEPSTGLDPASRQLLWNVIRAARRERAVVLTTHSMEEAEVLCDRLGIFVGGRLRCLGDPKDLVSRFGGYMSLSVTTPVGQEAAAAAVVRSLSPSARLVYALGGTQRFELPVGEAGVDAIFARMEGVKARRELEVLDWGVSNATLEEVFIRIIRDAGVKMGAFA